MFFFKEKKSKNKAQSLLEFGMAIIPAMLLVLGSFDVMQLCVTKMDLSYMLRKNLQDMTTQRAWAMQNGGGVALEHQVVKNLKDDLVERTFFCTKVDGNLRSNCSQAASPVEISNINMRFMIDNKVGGNAQSGTTKAGTAVCIAATANYKPLFVGTFASKQISITQSSCSTMEFSTKVKSSYF